MNTANQTATRPAYLDKDLTKAEFSAHFHATKAVEGRRVLVWHDDAWHVATLIEASIPDCNVAFADDADAWTGILNIKWVGGLDDLASDRAEKGSI